MIEYREGDIFEQSDITHILHQCNLFHSFSNGIAASIRLRYPEAFEVDKRTVIGATSRLGSFTIARCRDGKTIINLYSQVGIGATDRQTSYDAMCKGLLSVHQALARQSAVLGIPARLGSGLANGSWTIVEAIIKDTFAKSPLKVVICKLVEPTELLSK